MFILTSGSDNDEQGERIVFRYSIAWWDTVLFT